MSQITVDRRAFGRAMTLAQSVISRSNIPALAMIRATANGSLALETSDLDTFARVDMAYTGNHATFLIPDGRRLMGAINAAGNAPEVSLAPTCTIERDHENGKLDATRHEIHVVAGPLNAALRTLPVDDFPTMESVATDVFAADLGADAVAQIARLLPAISTEQTRYYLNGICVEKVGEWLWRFCATDGHRLFIVEIPLPGAVGEIPDRTIVPRRWINLALVHFRNAQNPVRLSYGPRAIRNQVDAALPLPATLHLVAMASQIGDLRLTLTTKLIDGNYPDVMRVVPRNPVAFATMDRAALVRAVNAVAAISSEKTRAVRLTFGQDDVTVRCQSVDLGQASLTIACRHNLHEGTHAGFNGRYLLDTMNVLRGEDVHFAWDADAVHTMPALITDPADTAFRAVVMPMRV